MSRQLDNPMSADRPAAEPSGPAGAEPILRAEGLTKAFGRGPARTPVLRGVDLSVRPGEFLAIMGSSGSGKTTLLHILGLLSRPDGGTLRFQGHDAVAIGEAGRTTLRRRAMGFVFQRFNLLGVLSARQNVALSLRLRGQRADGDAIDALLERMGVAHVARRKPGRMSIGEQQRVAVARAIAHRPALLLADEPTGSLDSKNADALLELLTQASRTDGQTLVMITHAPEAAARADRILWMDDGRLLDHQP